MSNDSDFAQGMGISLDWVTPGRETLAGVSECGTRGQEI